MGLNKLALRAVSSGRSAWKEIAGGTLVSASAKRAQAIQERVTSSHFVSLESSEFRTCGRITQEFWRGFGECPDVQFKSDIWMHVSVSRHCLDSHGLQLTGQLSLLRWRQSINRFQLMKPRFFTSGNDSGSSPPVDSSTLSEEEHFDGLANDVLNELQDNIKVYGEEIYAQGNHSGYSDGVLTNRLRSPGTHIRSAEATEPRLFAVTEKKLELREQIVRSLVQDIMNLENVNLVGYVLNRWIRKFASKRDLLRMLDDLIGIGSGSKHYLLSRFVPYNEVARIVHAVMQIVGERGNLEGALEVLRWMETQGWCELDPHLYTTIIDTLGKAGSIELAENIFRSLEGSQVEKDGALCNAMINARGKAGQIDLVEDLFESMKRSNCKPDLVTYNTVMNSYVKAGMGLGTVVSVFKDMYSQGIDPDIVSFNILLEGCISGKHVKEAQKIFKNLKKRALKPTVITYTTLVTLYANSGQCLEALKLVSEMIAQSCQPNALTFSSLITACARDGFYGEGERLFQVMKDHGVEPNVVTYNSMIDLYRKQGKHNLAQQMYTEMKGAGLRPSSVTATSLMSCYKASGAYDEVFSILEEAKKESICNVHVFSEAIDCCIKWGKLQRISDIQSDMLAVNCSPDVVTCSIILSALGSRCSSAEDACVLVGFLQAFDSELISNSRGMLLELMTSDEEVQGNIQSLFLLLDKEDIRTWTVFSSALVDALWALGWYRRAAQVVAWVMEKGLFDDICVIHSQEWKLDLRRLSSGAAVVALYQWLGHLVIVARWLESAQGKGLVSKTSAQMSREMDGKDGGVTGEISRNSSPESPIQVEVLLPLQPSLPDVLHDKGVNVTRNCELGFECPSLVTVVTGWGKLSKQEGSSIVRNIVQKEILKLRAPFRCSADSGKWMSKGEALMRWLMKPDTAARLILSDLVPEAENVQ